MSRPAIARMIVLGASALSFAALAVSGGCTLDRSGSIELTCSTNEECDDGTPCTADTCNPEGLCDHPAFDGTDSILQVPFDCNTLVCQEGREVKVPDDADVPTSDCVVASCSGGVLTQTNKTDGTPCTKGAGSGFCVDGECKVDCDEPQDPDCDDGLQCTNDDCDLGSHKCVNEPLDNVPAPEGNQSGDCQLLLCVAGQEQLVPDDSDLPTDGNECTEDKCDNGVPSNPFLLENTPCGAGGLLVCNEAGVCVGCNDASNCVDDNPNDCILPDCVNESCTTTLANPGAPCNDALFCTASDSCTSGGQCAGSGNPCPGPDGDGNCSESCSETNDNCGAADPNNTGCNDGTFCNGTDSCSGGQCNQHSGNPCPGHNVGPACNDSCSESADNCMGPDSSTTSCNDGLFCTQTDTCNGSGSCAGAGNPCPGHNVGPACNDSCNEGANNCTGADSSSTSCSDGQFCNGNETCNGSGSCTSPGNPCPGHNVGPACNDSCNEGANMCSANDPDGTSCGSTSFCVAGSCTGCGSNPAPVGGCTGGTAGFTLVGSTCVLDCKSTSCPSTITCPPGRPCEVLCDGNGLCNSTAIQCPTNYTCAVDCSGGNPSTCDVSTVTCGANQCNVTCNGSNKPQVNCGASCGCNLSGGC